jgi:hypothetical protein
MKNENITGTKTLMVLEKEIVVQALSFAFNLV